MGAGASALETLHKRLEETSETDLANAVRELSVEARDRLRTAIGLSGATGQAENKAQAPSVNVSTPRGEEAGKFATWDTTGQVDKRLKLLGAEAPPDEVDATRRMLEKDPVEVSPKTPRNSAPGGVTEVKGMGKQQPKAPRPPSPVTVTSDDLAEAVDSLISMGMAMDRQMKENEEDEAAPGEAGRMAQLRSPRLTRKSKELAEQFQALMGPKLEAIFHQFDADGNGTLDASELKAAFDAAGRPADDETIASAMKKLDTDGDGVISLEEFKAIAWQVGRGG